MILAVDAGNSAVTLGCVEGRDILNLARLETSPGRSADEYAVLMERVLALRGVKLREFEGAAIASVVPPLRKLTDVSKLHSLGWQHKIDIEEGVHRMYQWYLS